MPEKRLENIDKIIENIREIITQYGFDKSNITIDLTGEDEEGRFVFRVEVKGEDKESQTPVVDYLPVSFEIGATPRLIVDASKVMNIAKKAGAKKYVIGKYSVYSTSPERAIESVASIVSYPYETESGIVLRNKEEFVNYYMDVFRKVAEKTRKASEVEEKPMDDAAIEKAIQEALKELEKEPTISLDVLDIPSPYEVAKSSSVLEENNVVDETANKLLNLLKEIYSEDQVYSSVIKEASIETDQTASAIKRAINVLEKVAGAVKNTIESWGIKGEPINVKLLNVSSPDNFEIEITFGKDERIKAIGSVVESNGELYLDTIFMDLVKKEYDVKKYKFASYEGFSIDEAKFIENLLEEAREEEKEEIEKLQNLGVKPIHIVREDIPDARVTWWKIEQEDNGFVLKRLDNQLVL